MCIKLSPIGHILVLLQNTRLEDEMRALSHLLPTKMKALQQGRKSKRLNLASVSDDELTDPIPYSNVPYIS